MVEAMKNRLEKAMNLHCIGLLEGDVISSLEESSINICASKCVQIIVSGNPVDRESLVRPETRIRSN